MPYCVVPKMSCPGGSAAFQFDHSFVDPSHVRLTRFCVWPIGAFVLRSSSRFGFLVEYAGIEILEVT
jgi:hypothetical protein